MAECIEPRSAIGILLAFSAIYLAVTAGVMAWRERRRSRIVEVPIYGNGMDTDHLLKVIEKAFEKDPNP